MFAFGDRNKDAQLLQGHRRPTAGAQGGGV
jgi:hypothetical protein